MTCVIIIENAPRIESLTCIYIWVCKYTTICQYKTYQRKRYR